MNNYSFGNYIFELREKKGLSQSQLGAKLGVTNKAVSRWENGNAYPSTELMLPLAKELGVTIEELYKVISEDKTPKTKLRRLLESLMQRTKIITGICLAMAIIPYVLFLCFSSVEDKSELAMTTPIVMAIVYTMLYCMFVLFRKNPSFPAKTLDIYTMILLIVMSVGYLLLLKDFVLNFPNGFSFSLCLAPVAVMAAIHTLKRRYR